MDRFKKYLQQNAGRLDTDTPPDEIWQKIELQTSGRRKKQNARIIIFRYAAAACILALLVIVTRKEYTGAERKKQPLVFQNNNLKIPVRNDTVKNKPTALPSPVVISEHTKHRSVTPKNQNNGMEQKPDNSYEHLINIRVKQLSNMPVLAASPGYFNVFVASLKQMDKDEQAIKDDIRRHGYNEQLMDELIEVYQQKLNLLKRFQSEIQKINNRMKQQRPIASSPKPYYLQL